MEPLPERWRKGSPSPYENKVDMLKLTHILRDSFMHYAGHSGSAGRAWHHDGWNKLTKGEFATVLRAGKNFDFNINLCFLNKTESRMRA